MSLLTLIPTPILAGGAVLAVVASFGGGVEVKGWRDASALDAEKASHVKDVQALKDEWQGKLNAAQTLMNQAVAERDAERQANDLAREDAQNAHEATIKKLQAAVSVAASDAQRVRNELAAAEAAGRSASGSGSVQQGAASAPCSGPGGATACGLLSRAIDLARRCAETSGEQHAAVVEAIASWPK